MLLTLENYNCHERLELKKELIPCLKVYISGKWFSNQDLEMSRLFLNRSNASSRWNVFPHPPEEIRYFQTCNKSVTLCLGPFSCLSSLPGVLKTGNAACNASRSKNQVKETHRVISECSQQPQITPC